jgi:ribosomal protein S18 acetylase RimI-like enzyme
VRAELRSRGVARALLAAALDAARRAGAPEVHTEVDEKNAASQALLFGIGGEQTGAWLELVREAAGPLELRLRASTPDDAEAIALVQVRSALAGFAGFRPDGALASLDPEERVPLWRERRAIVADTDDGVVGFVQHGPSGDEPAGEIQRFFVAPECRGEGVGRALMRCALAELRDAGFGEAVLWVHTDNDRARRFYEGCGWRPDGAERDEEAFGEVVQELRHRIRLDRGLVS